MTIDIYYYIIIIEINQIKKNKKKGGMNKMKNVMTELTVKCVKDIINGEYDVQWGTSSSSDTLDVHVVEQLQVCLENKGYSVYSSLYVTETLYAIIMTNNNTVKVIVYERCGKWLQDVAIVIPHLVPVSSDKVKEVLQFSTWYNKHVGSTLVSIHMPQPVYGYSDTDKYWGWKF